MAHPLAEALIAAEERLRSEGLTGARAFDALILGLRARLGDEVEPTPLALHASADIPLDGAQDLFGLAFERFFPELFKGRRGQFFTPEPIVRLLWSGLEDATGAVLDPTCGSGGLLREGARRGLTAYGVELDPKLVELARLNLRLGGLDAAIERGDAFAAELGPVDVLVANPPFSVEITEPGLLAQYELARGRSKAVSDVLFVEAMGRWVRPEGWAAVILPWSFVANPAMAPARALMRRDWHVRAICALPEGVFRPFGGAAGRAAVLWLRRRPVEGGATRWASLADPGYDVRRKHHHVTTLVELERLCRGEGFERLPDGAWLPSQAPVSGVELARVAKPVSKRASGLEGPVQVIELADTDKRSGVGFPRCVDAETFRSAKNSFPEGAVLVSRLRPDLGNVVQAPVAGVGSTEWVALESDAPRYLLHALRTPSWRAQVSVTQGQTRPRTTQSAVLKTKVPWPGGLVERVDAVSATLERRRAAALEGLAELQAMVDALADGSLDSETLEHRLRSLERSIREDET